MVIEEENKESSRSKRSGGAQRNAGGAGRTAGGPYLMDSGRRDSQSNYAGNSDSQLSDGDDDSAKNRKAVINESDSSFDPQEFLFEKKRSLEHFFISVYEQLSHSPYSMQFYLSLPKYMVRQDSGNQDFLFELLRRTLRNISDDQIDMFLYYDTESAL